MEKVYVKAKEWLLKAMLTLSVLGLGISSAMAQTGLAKDDPFVLENGEEYSLTAFKNVYATFTASADGTLIITAINAAPQPNVYTDATYETLAETQPTWNGLYSPKVYELKVTAGTTYYISNMAMDNSAWQVSFSTGETVVEVTDVTPNESEPLSATGGLVNISFNRGVSVKEVTLSANKESVTLTPDAMGTVVSLNVGAQMMEWYEAEKLKEGDELTLTLNGIQAENSSQKVKDETLTLKYKAAAAPITLVSEENTPGNGMDVFSSYIFREDGIVTLTFSGKVGSEPTARLAYGNPEYENSYYEEQVPVNVEGNKLTLDLGGKRRLHTDMLPNASSKTPAADIALEVGGICGADGQYAYTGNFSSFGKLSFTYDYKEADNVEPLIECTPAAGSELVGGSELEIWIANDVNLRYDGVQFSYVHNGGTQVTNVAMDKITKTSDPVEMSASILTLTVPNLSADEGTQVKISLNNLEAADGADYVEKLSASFNYKASTTSLKIVSSTPKEGDVLETLENVMVHTDQDASIGCMTVGVYDLNPASPDMACLWPDENMTKNEDGSGFNWSAFFPIEMVEGHDYALTFTAYPTEMDAMQQINAMGTAKVTVKGATKAFQFSPVTLVSVTPDPSEGFASAEDTLVTATFSAPVEITAETAFVNMGFGTTLPLDSIGWNEDKTVWTFVIPEYAMTTGNAVMLSVSAKDADGLLVEGNTGVEENSYFEWSFATPFNSPDLIVAPSNEETQQTLKEFTVTVDGGLPIGLAYSATEELVVWNMFQETVATGTVELVIPEDKQADYEAGAYDPVKAKITLDQEITEAGRFILHIPEGYFWLGTQYSAVLNKTTNVTYAVEGVAMPLVPTTVEPADKSTVEELSTVTLTVDCDVVTLLAIGEDADPFITVTNKATGEEVDVTATVDDLDYENWTNMNQVVIRFSEPITAEGTYVLTIAPELFADDQWDPMFGTGSANAELTYEFTVGEGDGVSSVSVDEGKVTVYTLNGVKVLDNADRESLKTLKKGIYIVNGKKTVVK